MRSRRGQSNVVGVALLLGIAIVSMGALTATIGAIVDSNAAEADATRVAADIETALDPVASTGPRRGTVSFSDGTLSSTERTLQIRVDGTVTQTVRVDALVFESADQRVTFHTGAVVRGEDDHAWMVTPPPITVDEDVLVVSATKLGDNTRSVSGTGGVEATLETDVSHDRVELGDETFSIAIETETPGAWERFFREQNATVAVETGSPPVVVATFEGSRTGYLVIHDLSLEVSGGG